MKINKSKSEILKEKEFLAQKLLSGEIGPIDLTEEENKMMMEFFKRDIEDTDRELEKIKKHILEMRKLIK